MMYDLNDLEDQGDRIANLLRQASQPQGPSIGDAASAPGAAYRAGLANMSGGAYQDPYAAYQAALKGTQTETQANAAKQALAEGQIYDLIQKQKAAGDEEAKLFDTKVSEVVDDPNDQKKVWDGLYQDENDTGEELTAANIKMKALTVANRLGLRNRKYDLEMRAKEANIKRDEAYAARYEMGDLGSTEKERIIARLLDPNTSQEEKDLLVPLFDKISGGAGAGIGTLGKEVSKDISDFAAKSNEGMTAIRDAEYAVNEIDDLLKVTSTGKGPQTAASLDYFNLMDNTQNLQKLDALTNRMALAQNAGLKGPTSDRDIAFLKGTIANGGTSKEAAQYANKVAKQFVKREKAKVSYVNDLLKNPKYRGSPEAFYQDLQGMLDRLPSLEDEANQGAGIATPAMTGGDQNSPQANDALAELRRRGRVK